MGKNEKHRGWKKSSLQRHTTVRIKNRNVWGWKSAFVKIKMMGMMIETTVVYATDFSRRRRRRSSRR